MRASIRVAALFAVGLASGNLPASETRQTRAEQPPAVSDTPAPAQLARAAEAAAPPAGPPKTEISIFGFEGSLEGWQIPDWASSSQDYVGQGLQISDSQASEGRFSMTLQADFPGDRWTGVYVEREIEVADWSPFGQLSLDLYVPPEAPEGLLGRIILTVGEEWVWTEMNHGIPLAPGRWTAITVNLKPGSMDWKFFPDDAFRRRVRKLGVRIESGQHGPAYRGPVYVDRIRLSE